jgi:D-glycero-D-manno-heptose 1,7-bisphosphate phosphatase
MDRRKVVFMDRDGVLNEKAPEGDYVKSWKEFRFLPDVPEALAALNGLGFLLVVVTNQRGVALGIVSEEVLDEIHRLMAEELRTRGAHLDAIYYCPHDTIDECECRKPRPGMVERAVADLRKKGIEPDLEKSYMIGDSERDMGLGRTVGLRTVKVGSPSAISDLTTRSLFDFSRSLK